MDRRTALKYVGVGAIAATAGCATVEEQPETTAPSGGEETTDRETSAEETTEAGPAGTAAAWYSLAESELPAREGAIEQFNQESRHTVEGSDISDLNQKATSTIPAGEGPHLFDWAHDWVGDYYQRGFIVDQSEHLSVSLDQFTDAAAGAVQFEGNVVGLPHSAETVALLYNRDVVDEPPETVAEMRAIMDDYHDPSDNKYGIGYPVDPYFSSAWAQAFGGYYFDPEQDPMLGLTNDETVEGFEYLFENFADYMPKDPGYNAQAAVFAEGNAAFAINGPWYLATLNEKGIDAGVTALPEPEGGSPRPYTGITLWYFAKAMDEDGADAEAARSFAEWYATNEDLILQAAEERGDIPVLSSLAGSDELPPKVQGFSKAVQQGYPMPTHPRMNQVWEPLTNAITKAFNGDASVADAMSEAESSIRSNWD